MNSVKKSFAENRVGIILMVAASLQTALGQMFWKIADGEIFSFAMIGGFVLYFLGAVCMIISFRFGSLSVLHPLLSIGYVFALFFGGFILEETITAANLIGTLLIMIGAAFIGGGDH